MWPKYTLGSATTHDIYLFDRVVLKVPKWVKKCFSKLLGNFSNFALAYVRSQVVSSKQPKLVLTQELSFSRISVSTTVYIFTPCVASFASPGIGTR